MMQQIKGRIIVSCQALSDEPLHGSDIMAKMAIAAEQGGAAAIRANSKEDIIAIKNVIQLPMIGIVKRDYPDSDVFITPTLKEVQELLDAKTEVVTIDATSRQRPGNLSLEEMVDYIRQQSKAYIMADISTFEEGIMAIELGADFISTTLSGYTPYSPQMKEPDFELIKQLSKLGKVPVIAEGRISTPAQAKKALELGAFSVVVGSAITRPQLITKRFVEEVTLLNRNIT
ncbi:N-acetylmannosamine-6-phosphate 2-epimerase [Fictibacillus arsenicus]|uniref:Putative N-acetylmannosamine-6-phosphate 2-epimerase n=1 Tax=Fictibacillus arsenicus TaxID=255247 RepID=A0A1B1Z8M3_9BACL|nr:N-acetylmannosamine-6-phosphate 2-epimerase [Fictibacillus arsenicus]